MQGVHHTLMQKDVGDMVDGSRAGIRTPVTGAKAPHPWPLDDPATGFDP